MSTFASGSVPEPGNQVIPPASVMLRCFNSEHAWLEVERICAQASMGLSVRSRPDT